MQLLFMMDLMWVWEKITLDFHFGNFRLVWKGKLENRTSLCPSEASKKDIQGLILNNFSWFLN